MTNLNKEILLALGGKAWEKENVERVYLTIGVVRSLIETKNYAPISSPSKKMVQAKTFFDVKTGILKSDVGMIRSALNSAGFPCEK